MLCGRMVFCGVSGNSLGFRGLGRFGVDYCTLGNLECAIFGVRGGAVGGYGETFAPFCRGGTWRGRFAWVETLSLCFRETSGCFRGIWKLGRLIWARKNLCSWRVWKRFGAFREIWKLRGVVLRVWKLGTLAHEKLSVCIRGLVELWWLSGWVWNLERVRWSGVVVLLFRFSGNSVAFVVH